MIVHKINKTFQTRSDKPNENWLNNDEYCVVNDSSELAQLIIDNYPHFELVIDNGVIIDVIIDEENKQKELYKNNTLKEIEELKQKLSDTDYQAIKYAEGFLTEEEYTPIKVERQAWRDKINQLEAEMED